MNSILPRDLLRAVQMFAKSRDILSRIAPGAKAREVKIVVVTASAFASQREEVLAADFDVFLRKPYRPREIFDCMARHLGVRYMYRAKPQATAGNQPPTLRPQDFAALPAVLRDELEKAVVSLDRNRTHCTPAEIMEAKSLHFRH